MAEAYTGVGLGVQSPDMLTKLSSLLTIKSQQQALQGQAAEVAGLKQTQAQRAGLAKYDFHKHIGDDGTIDLNSLNSDPELRTAAGDQYLDVLAHAASAKEQQLAAKQKLIGLKSDQRNALSDMLGPLLSDKDVVEGNDKGKQKVNDAFIQYGELYGKDVLPVIATYAPGVQKAPPHALASGLRAIQMQAQSASQQVASQQPSLVSTDAALKNTNPNAAADAATNLPLTVAPGEQDTVISDQLGNQYRLLRDPGGGISGVQPLANQGGTGPARFGPGERGALEHQAQTNFEAVTANRQAASMAPQQLDQIDKALKLSKDVSTGAWAQKRANIESGVGSLIPGFSGLDDASKLQELDKFSERIATDASRVLGVNAKTDAERESIHKQNANIGYTPQAIQSVLQYAKAQTMAMEAKGNAQEKWLKQEGNGITKQHDFETAFRQAYDPVIFQIQAANPAERKKIVESLDAQEAASLKDKRAKLRELGAL